MRAGRRYMEELAGQASAEGRPLEPKRPSRYGPRWPTGSCCRRSAPSEFLASQRELIRASTELRIAQQDLVEHFGKQYGFPTRTELDDVHRALTEMRRELRRVQAGAGRCAGGAGRAAARWRPAEARAADEQDERRQR